MRSLPRAAVALVALACFPASATAAIGAGPDGLELTRSYASLDGVTHLVWRQAVAGVPVFGAELFANVARDGRLISIGGAPVPRLPKAVAAPKLDAGAALGRVLE